MSLRPLLSTLALLSALTALAPTATAGDPRTPINAINTPPGGGGSHLISKPGSYYLEGTVTGFGGFNAIVVASSNVQIDLMGHELNAVLGGLSAIVSTPSTQDITIFNGSARSWELEAIDLKHTVNARVRNVHVPDAGMGGIVVGAGGVVEGCRVQGPTHLGIQAGPNSSILDCRVEDARPQGGISVGISVGDSSIVRSCIVNEVGSNGVVAGPGSLVISCTVTAAGSMGIHGDRILVRDSNVRAGGGPGISLLRGTVRNCDVSENEGHGIEITTGSGLVVGNQVAGNGGDGIRIHGGARVEDNDVRHHASGLGIHVTGSRSFVVKNSLFGNSNPMFVTNAGNFAGPLVSANAVYGRSDPWSNVSWN